VTSSLQSYIKSLFEFYKTPPVKEPSKLPVIEEECEDPISIISQIDPTQLRQRIVQSRFPNVEEGVIDEHFNPLLSKPILNEPLYKYLKELSLSYLIPNYNKLKENTVSLYKENRKFIEAVMCGANHELMNELLFREFSLLKNHTILTLFWDSIVRTTDRETGFRYVVPDIQEIRYWDQSLGDNGGFIDYESDDPIDIRKDDDRLIFVFRSELFRKYPNTAVYIAKLSNTIELSTLTEDLNNYSTEKHIPTILASLSDDCSLFGFDLVLTDITESYYDNSDEEYFLIVEQHMTHGIFGLDISDVSTSGSNSDEDLYWPKELINGYLYNGTNLSLPEDHDYHSRLQSVITGTNSAKAAQEFFQKPIRAFIPISTLLGFENDDSNNNSGIDVRLGPVFEGVDPRYEDPLLDPVPGRIGPKTTTKRKKIIEGKKIRALQQPARIKKPLVPDPIIKKIKKK